MLAYFGIILTVLLGFCGLAIDTARVELRTSQLQTAADAGALAAATEIWHNAGGSAYVNAANNDIASIETLNNIPTNSTNTVLLGPDYGPYTGDYSAVEVTVSQPINTLFLGLLNHANASVTASARATAQLPPCMLFFGNPTVSNGFNGTGNNNWDYQIASAGVDSTPDWGCPLYSTDGFNIDYFSRYSGAQIRTSSTAAASSISGSAWSTPIYNVPKLTDPLAYVNAPSPGACKNSAPISQLNMTTGQTYSLLPGTYCGKSGVFAPSPHGCGAASLTTIPAIDIEGKSNGVGCPTQGGTNGNICTTNPTLALSPGMYIFIGGINLECVTVTGSGVTAYFTNSSNVPGYGLVQIICSTWNASAPNDASAGGIPGVAIMTDRNWNGGNQDLQIHYSTWYADGIIYSMRTGLFAYALPMSAPNYMNVVAANMYTYDAEVRPSNNYANLPNGDPMHINVTLVQ